MIFDLLINVEVKKISCFFSVKRHASSTITTSMACWYKFSACSGWIFSIILAALSNAEAGISKRVEMTMQSR